MSKRVVFLTMAYAFLCSHADAFAQDLTKLSLEDLMNVDIYTASKMPERYFDTAASIYVITPEDIRRSGATSIPELLRMVPGLNVQQINSHTWDISARGFNGSVFADKLLVLMDGRAVYSPLLGGVFWELQDTVLEDIERIEVIRGPGGTMWGANAVNGVINIITKKAKDTQGGLVSVGGGSSEKDFSTVRYGAKADDWYYRAYAKYFDRAEGYRPTHTADDEWQEGRTGFRAEKNEFTIQGDYYQEYLGQRVTLASFDPPYNVVDDKTSYAQGGNLLGRYEDDEKSIQTYWEATNENFQDLKELRQIFDVDYNQHRDITLNQELNWGAGYRLNLEDITGTETISIIKPGPPDELFNMFGQDTIKMLDDRLKLAFGTKLEYNIYTHVEVEPNTRLSYEINEKNVVWVAASRAVRTPSRLESDGLSLSAANAPILFVSLRGNHDLSAEQMRSFELGYRTQPTKSLVFDFSTFADHYDRLITYEPESIITENGFPVQLFTSINGEEANAYGIEISSDLQIREWWKIKGSYTFTKLDVSTNPGITDIGLESYLENAVPENNAYLRSSFDLPKGFQLDTILRYMDEFQMEHIPSNTELDVNLEKTIKGWEVAIVGQNLLRSHHKESYAGVSTATTQIERGGYLKVTRRF